MTPRMSPVPEGVAARYVAAFAGRTDVYGVYTADGWRPRRQPLAPSVVTQALASRSPVALYFLPADGMSHVAAIDFDAEEGFDQAVRVGIGMWGDRVPAYVESSRRGAHLWVVVGECVHARILRMALRAYLQTVGLPIDDKKIELRPGDALRSADGIGLSLRGPMMPHPLTGVSALLLDPRSRQPLGDSVSEVVEAIQQAPAARMGAAAERYRPPEPPPAPRYPPASPRFPARTTRYPSQGGSQKIERFNAENTASAVLVREFGLARAAPRRSVRCPGPAHRNGDRTPSLSILPDDRRAYCHLPGCVFNGNGHGVDAFDLGRIAKGSLR